MNLQRTLRNAAASVLLLTTAAWAQQPAPPVTLQEDETSWTIANGIVTAKVMKNNSTITSILYKGIEVIADGADRRSVNWSHLPVAPEKVLKVTINPADNGGERVEVSVKGICNGQKQGSGPGGGFIADIEVRYSLARGESGIYTYCNFEHPEKYPADTMGEARCLAKIGDLFDWMTASPTRNMLYPAPKDRVGMDWVENKYNYTQIQYDNPAFGWSSTTKKVGFWFVNGSTEYLSGGPTKTEFQCHRDTTQIGAPCILQYWRSSHYGGSSVDVAAGEYWTKTIGPFLLYFNSGETPQAMYEDALARQKQEAQQWPFAWAKHPDYPLADQRGTVVGKLKFNDPQAKSQSLSKLMVGLAHPDYHITTTRAAAQNSPADINWQVDAKHYEFWVPGASSGEFKIAHVRPGTYTLHAFANDVVGEFAKTDVVVKAGETLDLGELEWKPVRHGKQVWELGIADRSAAEFLGGDQFTSPRLTQLYRESIPNGVNFVVGKSDPKKDWFIRHTQGGEAGKWNIQFEMPKAATGKATMRVALAGKQSPFVEVAVNGQSVGRGDGLWFDSSLGRNQIRGTWDERAITFDAALLKSGTNTISLIIGQGGVMYDYLRLELDETPVTASVR